MMIQAKIPAAFGLYFTRWLFEAPIVIASMVTIFATTLALVVLNTRRVASPPETSQIAEG
jgi:hypothetical protein